MKSAFDILEEEYNRNIKGLSAAVIDGACHDMEEYRDITGQIKGLKVALREVQTLRNLAEDE